MPGYSFDVEAMCNEVTSNKSANGSESNANSSATAKPSVKPNSDWNLLSQAIDRILFVFYLLIILIFLATYIGGIANTEANLTGVYDSGFSQ